MPKRDVDVVIREDCQAELAAAIHRVAGSAALKPTPSDLLRLAAALERRLDLGGHSKLKRKGCAFVYRPGGSTSPDGRPNRVTGIVLRRRADGWAFVGGWSSVPKPGGKAFRRHSYHRLRGRSTPPLEPSASTLQRGVAEVPPWEQPWPLPYDLCHLDPSSRERDVDRVLKAGPDAQADRRSVGSSDRRSTAAGLPHLSLAVRAVRVLTRERFWEQPAQEALVLKGAGVPSEDRS